MYSHAKVSLKFCQYVLDLLKSKKIYQIFLRALREVAPEIEIFLENHGQYVKNFVIKLIYIQSCTFPHFTKKLHLEEYVWKYIPPHFFCGSSLPKTTLESAMRVINKIEDEASLLFNEWRHHYETFSSIFMYDCWNFYDVINQIWICT